MRGRLKLKWVITWKLTIIKGNNVEPQLIPYMSHKRSINMRKSLDVWNWKLSKVIWRSWHRGIFVVCPHIPSHNYYKHTHSFQLTLIIPTTHFVSSNKHTPNMLSLYILPVAQTEDIHTQDVFILFYVCIEIKKHLVTGVLFNVIFVNKQREGADLWVSLVPQVNDILFLL